MKSKDLRERSEVLNTDKLKTSGVGPMKAKAKAKAKEEEKLEAGTKERSERKSRSEAKGSPGEKGPSERNGRAEEKPATEETVEDPRDGRRFSVGRETHKGKRKVRYIETSDTKKSCRFLS